MATDRINGAARTAAGLALDLLVLAGMAIVFFAISVVALLRQAR